MAMHVTHGSPSSISSSRTAPEVEFAAPLETTLRPHAADTLLSFIDRNRRRVFLVLILVYLAGFNAQWRLEPDSALYLAVGHNLAEGLGYTFQGKHNVLAYPGLPAIFAAVFKVFPTHSLLPALVLMMLLGLAALSLVYRLFLLHADRPTAVIVTLGVAISRVFYRYCFELLTEIPFLVGVLAFLVGHEAIFNCRQKSSSAAASPGDDEEQSAVVRPKWYDWGLLVAGLVITVTTRPAMWALVFALVAAPLWSLVRGNLRWSQVIICVLVIGGAIAFYSTRHASHPNLQNSTSYVEEDQMFQLTVGRLNRMASQAFSNIPTVFDRTLAKAAFGTALGLPLNLVLNTTIVALGIALIRVRPLWGLLVLTTLLMVLLVPKPQERYFLPVIPLLVFAWWRGLQFVNRRLPARWGNWAFLLLFAIGVLPNSGQVLAFIIDQRRPAFLLSYKEGRYASVDDAAAMIAGHTPPSGAAINPLTTWILVPSKFARILTFRSRRYAIEPDESTHLDPYARESWRHIYVLEPSNPQHLDPGEKRPTVQKWLNYQKLEVIPEPLASVPNRDPDAKEPWTLHRVRPVGSHE